MGRYFSPKPSLIANVIEGTVLLAGKVCKDAPPLTPLWKDSKFVVYEFHSGTFKESEMVSFWLEDESGRALIQKSNYLLLLPSQNFATSSGSTISKQNKKHIHFLKKISLGENIYVFGKAKRVADARGNVIGMREIPTVLTLSGTLVSPLVLSNRPFIKVPPLLRRWARRVFS